MKIPAELLVKQFFRSYTEPFTSQDFAGYLSRCGIKANAAECEEYLSANDSVFSLSDDVYITRAGAFTNRWFSFKPGRKELDKGVFIIGHRCVPFVDPEILACGYTFLYKKKVLSQKVIEIDSTALSERFCLYGDEYSSQYIAQDPANEGMDLAAMDYTLPPVVKNTGIDISALVKDGFTPGDRLLCRVIDWSSCIIEIDFVHRSEEHLQMTMADVERERWYTELEKALLESFNLAGPLGSIEEQLALVFVDLRDKLCVKNCGSIEELFNRTTKVGFELFGVETRLWFKGQDVPAVGHWNNLDAPAEEDIAVQQLPEKVEKLPPYVIDAFIHDQLFSKLCDYETLLNTLYPNCYRISAFQQKALLLHLKSRHDILSADYNRFADSEIGDLRHKVLELFGEVNKLVYSIDLTCSDLTAFPQQSLVILSQIFAHIMHIIEVSEKDSASIVKDINELYLSVEGMEFNFECVSEELRAVLAKVSKNGFSVIK